MGALVGGIYCTGGLSVYKEWMCDLDRRKVFSLVDFTISSEGLVKGNKVLEEIQKMVPDVKIENMRIPFSAVATDNHCLYRAMTHRLHLHKGVYSYV